MGQAQIERTTGRPDSDQKTVDPVLILFHFVTTAFQQTTSFDEPSIVLRRVDANRVMLNNRNLNPGTRFQRPQLFQLFPLFQPRRGKLR